MNPRNKPATPVRNHTLTNPVEAETPQECRDQLSDYQVSCDNPKYQENVTIPEPASKQKTYWCRRCNCYRPLAEFRNGNRNIACAICWEHGNMRQVAGRKPAPKWTSG